MTVKTPIRTVFNESNVATGLAEYQTGEFIGVEHGGTGAVTLTSNAILLGNGTSAVQNSAIGISGTTLSSTDSTLITIAEGLSVTGALNVTGTITGSVTGTITGNADTATTLETARNIAGQSFDGSANITIAATDLSDTDQSLSTTDNVSFNNLTLAGDLTVNGTTTTVNSTTIEITNSFTFEGSTADANETVLGVVDPTADRTINLPDASGTIVLKDTTDTLTIKTLTPPIISSISNTGTLTLPTSTDTLVGRATTDTLTNKTIDANGTGNSITNLEVADFAGAAIVTEVEGIGSSDNDTSLPTSAAVKDYVDTQITAEDLDITTDSGTIAIDLDSETLTVAGGTGLDSSATGNTVTLAIDSTVATLTGSQTLTNKTIYVDSNTVTNIEVDNLKSGVLDTDLSTVAATDTTLASAKAIKTYVDSQVTAQDLDFQGDTGGALSIDLDSESLTIAGGTGIDTVGASNTLTVAIDSTVATLTDTQTLTNKTLTSPVLNTSISGTAFLDDDTFATASATTLASSESIKAYVDAQILTEDTLAELNDTNITSPADGALLFYDTGTSMWIDNVVSGDITIADTGVAAISSGVIVNDDINASAAISISKTALVDG